MKPRPAPLAALQLAAALLPAAAAPAFRAQTIDDAIQIGYGLAVADVDGDARPDILLADKHQIVWYRNPAWTKHVIAEKLTELDHVCVAAADVDGDGKAEVAAGAGWNPGDTRHSGALFFLQPPADRTQRWTPVPLPHEPTIHRIRWVRDGAGKFSLVSVPLHGRGNEPGPGTGTGVRVDRYVPPAASGGAWTQTLLHEALNRTHNFDVLNWDADPADELVIASRQGLFLSDPLPAGNAALTLLATNDLGGMGEVRAGRLGDGRRFLAAVEPMHGNTLALLRPPADTGLWTRTVLDESLVDGHALAVGDVLGLGHDQVVVGWRAMNRPGVKVGVKLLVPKDAAGDAWESHLLDDNTMACEDAMLADLDGDGDLDVIAAGRATRNVKLYWNERGAARPPAN
ncbi:MAG: FG-GAP repeat domain-containing protein [Limisphaerales bacterium]